MRRSGLRGAPLVLAVLALVAARPAAAWNPLEPVAAAAKRAGRALGGVVGSLVESAAAPTIRNAEVSGRRLVADVELALDRQLDHAGGVASKLVGEVDRSLGDKLERVDRSLEARIVQASVAADELVDRTFGRLEDSIGRVDDLARRRIDQIGVVGKDLIGRADEAAAKLLAQADAILERRAADVRQLVGDSLRQADDAAAARIEQLDELAGRRIGNLDVIATKQSLGLEGMLLRLAALVGMVAFLSFVLWRLFAEATRAWTEALAERSLLRIKRAVLRGAPRFLVQVGLGGAGIAGLYLLAGYLPRDAEARAGAQVAEHERALAAAFAAYDLTDVRYHSTQLEVLRTDEAPRYRALARKAELLRMVLGRPALTQSIAGVRQVAAELDAVEGVLGSDDPDLLTLKAFVTWRIGATRHDEYDAAALCARALQLGEAAPGGFLLEVLAQSYLRAFLHDPYPADERVAAADLARLRAALPAAAGRAERAERPQFQHLVAYNALVAKLDVESTAAYLDMLDAHAEYEAARGGAGGKRGREPAAAREARERRRAHAERVVSAWRAFDAELAASPWLADDPTALAAFTLDDSVLSRALYFVVVPEATALPPALVAEPGKLPEIVRVKIAPLRVAWARRYAGLVGPKAAEVLAIEEAQRFERFERRALDFERAYVALARALREPPAGDPRRLAEVAASAAAAIGAASEIGLHRDTPEGRRSVASILAASVIRAGGHLTPELERQIAEGHARRRLRFL